MLRKEANAELAVNARIEVRRHSRLLALFDDLVFALELPLDSFRLPDEDRLGILRAMGEKGQLGAALPLLQEGGKHSPH